MWKFNKHYLNAKLDGEMTLKDKLWWLLYVSTFLICYMLEYKGII